MFCFVLYAKFYLIEVLAVNAIFRWINPDSVAIPVYKPYISLPKLLCLSQCSKGIGPSVWGLARTNIMNGKIFKKDYCGDV